MASLFNDFRYSQSLTRSVPLGFVRSVDTNRYKAMPPNLEEIKTLTSSLADCSFATIAPSADCLLVLNAMQLVVQFTLYSQKVMRDKMNALQQQHTSDRASSSLVASLEGRCQEMMATIEILQSEKRSLIQRVQQVEAESGGNVTKVMALEKDLRAEKHLRLLATSDAHNLKALSAQVMEPKQHDKVASQHTHHRHSCHCYHRPHKHSRRHRSRRSRSSSSSSSSSTSSASSSDSRDYRRRKKSSKKRQQHVDPSSPPIPLACVYPTAAEGPREMLQARQVADQQVLQAVLRLEADNQQLKKTLAQVQKAQEEATSQRETYAAPSAPPNYPQQQQQQQYHGLNDLPRSNPAPMTASPHVNAPTYSPPMNVYQPATQQQSHHHVQQPVHQAPIAASAHQSYNAAVEAPVVRTPRTADVSRIDPPAASQSFKVPTPVQATPMTSSIQPHPTNELSAMEEYQRLKQLRSADSSATARSFLAKSDHHMPTSVVVSTVKRYDSLVQSDDDEDDLPPQRKPISIDSRPQKDFEPTPVITTNSRLPDSKPPTAVQSRRESNADEDAAALAANRFLSNLSKPKSGALQRFNSNISSRTGESRPKSPERPPARRRIPSSSSSSSTTRTRSSTSSGTRRRRTYNRRRSPSSSSTSSKSSASSTSPKRTENSTLVTPVKALTQPLPKLTSFDNSSTINSPVTKVPELKREASGILDASNSSVLRRPTSRLLQETQNELQRLLEEEAEAEARKAASKSQLD